MVLGSGDITVNKTHTMSLIEAHVIMATVQHQPGALLN